METQQTLPELFENSVKRFGGNIYVWEKSEGEYRGATYKEIQARVYQCAAGLMSLGVQKGDRIALVAEGRSDWVVAELGILYAGAINVPLSVKIEELSDLQFRIGHSGCRMVFVSGNHAHKVYTIREALPGLERIILLDALQAAQPFEVPFVSLLQLGAEFLSNRKEEFERRWRSLGGTDVANICYTSGTVADPKGIVLTHRNYTANVAQGTALYPLPQSFVTLLILPWDHAFAHTCGIYALAATGASIASVQIGKTLMETLRNIPVNIKEVRPTFLMSVPTLARSFRKGIEAGVRQKGPVAEKLLALGLRVSYAYNADGWSRGKGWRALLKPLVRLFDTILFSKIRENFGGRLQYFIGGGALLDVELQKFFYAIGIPMYQGYGLTEASPVISSNIPEKHKFGSSGPLVPDLELRICDEQGRDLPSGQKGEIVVKGENVMAGYWKNEKATAETIRNGWLHTGDLGYVDHEGFLYVLGREKSLLIGPDGEKYSPEGIEEMIVERSAYIDQIMLYNNQSPYTVALLVPNKEAIVSWLEHHSPAGTEAARLDSVLRVLEAEVNAYRSGGKHACVFPERWLPAALAVLPEPFTEQNRFMNSTLKMVRGKITRAYAGRIESMFTPGGREICNVGNREVIEALLKSA
jgi:long-chain acyl-CoA synthetase